jgi:hypothetical protein
MGFKRWFGNHKRGTKPDGWTDVTYGYGQYESRDYQDTWNWPWPPNPARETLRAVSNCWTGNQLPGYVNFIPGVPQSKFVWNQPTFYQNLPSGGGYNYRIGNIQYNSGFNIESLSQYGTAQMQQQALQAFQARTQVQP